MGDAAWPAELRGITESVVTTLGPNGLWNVAALGLRAPDSAQVTAQTWGRTRTWRNFDERGEGYVQFTRDPELFVEAALTVHEVGEPVLESADAWVQVRVERRDSGTENGTRWVEWALHPVDRDVEREVVPAFNRGYAAVIEGTVHASRLDVEAYETERLQERIDYCRMVVEGCGGDAEKRAFAALERAVSEDL